MCVFDVACEGGGTAPAAEVAAANGIFPDTYIAALIESGAVKAALSFDDNQLQPASLDLRLGTRAWRLRASFLPGAGKTVADRLEQVKLHEIDLQAGAVLETGCVYLVCLLEELALPADVSAAANPKSSTGRLDVFTRIIADGVREFDKIPPAYHGPLYLEISPRSFPILVRSGSRLAQMRFARSARSCGLQSGLTPLDSAALRALQSREQLVSDKIPDISSAGIALSVDLQGSAGGRAGRLIGYRSKRLCPVIDVDKPAACAVEDFWEPIYNRGSGQIVLDPNEFYILASREAVHVPPLYAAEMRPFDPLVGEFRVHYAGFFDPGFGHTLAGGAGARAVLEVRSHEVPFILEHGQIIGRLIYEPMLARPEKLYGAGVKSHYQAQKLKLSKHFKA
ncbi:MAG: 2'-deoxycytidine 5'-triphosphate deaminase [Candidatus Tokpelaia sp.]|nr:MAG: 2'-deoxycytidine 5'-triphosphate deaminase [Candidatus Tokpelaia sp.]KAA6205700.1 MAG: 2'-deoxycytidine 5'-triphosphate deaminase [Candidatus Tokpelaia sp.]